MRSAEKKTSVAGAERLEEIKAAAAKWFFRRGYEGTDLRRIAADVDLHPSSFYNYVHSKEELLYLVIKDGMTQILAGADRAVEGLSDPGRRLPALIRFHTLHHTRRRHTAWTNYVEFRALTGKYRAEIKAMRKQYEALWVETLRAGIEQGTFRPLDPEVTAYTIIATGQGIARWFNPRGRLTADEIAEQNVIVLTRGIYAEGAAGKAQLAGDRDAAGAGIGDQRAGAAGRAVAGE